MGEVSQQVSLCLSGLTLWVLVLSIKHLWRQLKIFCQDPSICANLILSMMVTNFTSIHLILLEFNPFNGSNPKFFANKLVFNFLRFLIMVTICLN